MWKSRLIRVAWVVSIGAVVVLVIGALGTRFGLVPTFPGMTLLAAGGALALLAIVFGLIGFLWSLFSDREQLGKSLASILLAAIVIGAPASMVAPSMMAGNPPIHDITTDTVNPPEFSAVMAARGEGSNSTDYQSKFVAAGPGGDLAGKSYAEVQLAAYPDIKPVILDVTGDEAFSRALAAAKAQGWEIVSEAPNTGRIEATDTTSWMRFKDDVVIRLTPVDNTQTKVDIRSTSRIGQGDLGKNAQRVRAYIATLTAE